MLLPASILVSSGADANITTGYWKNSLLKDAIERNDLEFAKKLLDHNADPNQMSRKEPIFFEAKTTAMAQLLVEYGLNIHVINDGAGYRENPNVLWKIAPRNDISADLMGYYLELGVNPKLIRDGYCLLHRLTHCIYDCRGDSEVFLKNAALLLNVIPEMINHYTEMCPDNQGKTPLDVANQVLCGAKKYNFFRKKVLKQLIVLLKEKGAMTGYELCRTQKKDFFYCEVGAFGIVAWHQHKFNT